MTTHPLLRTDPRTSTTDEPVVTAPRIDRSPGSRVGRAGLGAFRTPVRGHAFAPVPDGASRPEPGSRARLAREPSNPADTLAVAVWVEHDAVPAWRIGYLDRGVAARVAPRLDAGLRLAVRLDGWVAEPEGRWHRPLLHVAPDRGDPDRGDPDRGDPGRVEPDRGDPGSPAGTRHTQADGDRAAAEPAARGAAAGRGAGVPGEGRRETRPLWGRPPGVIRRVVRPG